jgi:hypothetical protein
MSNAIQTRTLFTAIEAAVTEAWDNITISVGEPRLPLALPYAFIAWNPVEVSFSGPGASLPNPSQHNSFDIYGRWPFPTDPTRQVELLKVDQANSLIAQLQSGSGFAGIGFLPLVTRVDPNGDDKEEGYYGVILTFEVYTTAPHH